VVEAPRSTLPLRFAAFHIAVCPLVRTFDVMASGINSSGAPRGIIMRKCGARIEGYVPEDEGEDAVILNLGDRVCAHAVRSTIRGRHAGSDGRRVGRCHSRCNGGAIGIPLLAPVASVGTVTTSKASVAIRAAAAPALAIGAVGIVVADTSLACVATMRAIGARMGSGGWCWCCSSGSWGGRRARRARGTFTAPAVCVCSITRAVFALPSLVVPHVAASKPLGSGLVGWRNSGGHSGGSGRR